MTCGARSPSCCSKESFMSLALLLILLVMVLLVIGCGYYLHPWE